MSAVQGPRLTIELELHAEPITGWLAYEHGPRQAFVGWLQLSALLEAARSADDDAVCVGVPVCRRRRREHGDLG